MDTTEEKEPTAQPLTVPVVANAGTVTIERRTMITGKKDGTEGKPLNKPKTVTTTIKSSHPSCAGCNKRFDRTKSRKRKLEGDRNENFRKHLRTRFGKDIQENSYACSGCYLEYNKKTRKNKTRNNKTRNNKTRNNKTRNNKTCNNKKGQ
jgi:hypothetical protein